MKYVALWFTVMMLVASGNVWAKFEPVTVEVVDDRGYELPLYPVAAERDESRNYLQAIQGERYGLKIRNNTAKRIGVVVAVDGRNIISGKPSYLKHHERMYILNPHQTQVYEGWRTGKNQVNRFYFSSEDHSYAAAWDDYSAMGTIAVAVFDQKPVYHQPQYQSRKGTAKSRARHKGDAGTGFGEESYSPSRVVEFEPQRHVEYTSLIKYEWRESLCQKGIISCHREQYSRHNRIWDSERYAPYPNWRRRH
jgi:hypothetical protein